MQAIAESRAVNWYYAHNGQQAGPVAETELEALVQRGVITPATLVWREGMAQWQPYSVVLQPTPTPQASAFDAPPVIDQGQCAECRRFFPKDDLLKYETALICATCKPSFFQKLREGVVTGSGLWRSGKYLVMHKESQLPDRCVKCNRAANGYRLKRNLSWHTPWLYLLLVAAWLIYLIIAMILSKKARIHIGLCEEHRRVRRRDLIISWILCLGGLTSLGMAVVMNPGWPYGLSGLGLILIALIYGLWRVPMVQPKRIDHEHVWLHGVTEAYMADLPEFTGRR